MTQTGTVYLTGAGPGDPDLLTLKALRLIETADVVVYDRLVSKQILGLIPQGTARIDVGKRAGSHPVPQDSINAILVKLARSGQMVVRLKGGDPMIFGRGGEEAEALQQQGIKVKTVPGITAAQGCAASLNLPLTLRGVADSLVFVTGHSKDDSLPDKDWARLADGQTTLAVYMGAANIGAITSEMLKGGVSGALPVLAVSNGTLDNQQHVYTTVSRLGEDLANASLDGPVLFVIGHAAAIVAGNEVDCHAEKIGIAAVSGA